MLVSVYSEKGRAFLCSDITQRIVMQLKTLVLSNNILDVILNTLHKQYSVSLF